MKVLSWEEDFLRKYPCPCGKGEYEYISYSNDWGSTRTEHTMLCSECREKYVYSSTVVYGHPGNEVERGWVLKSTIEAEEKRIKELMVKVHELYFELWKSKFMDLKTKKNIWEILTFKGKYYPSLGTFYRHTKGYTREKLLNYIDSFFNKHSLNRIFEICDVKPDYEYLGFDEMEIQKISIY